MWDFSEVIHLILSTAAVHSLSWPLPGYKEMLSLPAFCVTSSALSLLCSESFFFLSTFWGPGEMLPFQMHQKEQRGTAWLSLSSRSNAPLSPSSDWTLVWLGQSGKFKKKKEKKAKRKNRWFCFSVFVFFLPILSCSLGWTLHQCYSKCRSFSSEAVSRIFGSSEDKTSPQIWHWRATGKNLPASLPPHAMFSLLRLAFDLSGLLMELLILVFKAWRWPRE